MEYGEITTKKLSERHKTRISRSAFPRELRAIYVIFQNQGGGLIKDALWGDTGGPKAYFFSNPPRTDLFEFFFQIPGAQSSPGEVSQNRFLAFFFDT